MNQYKIFLQKKKCQFVSTSENIILRLQITEVLQDLLYDCLSYFQVV